MAVLLSLSRNVQFPAALAAREPFRPDAAPPEIVSPREGSLEIDGVPGAMLDELSVLYSSAWPVCTELREA